MKERERERKREREREREGERWGVWSKITNNQTETVRLLLLLLLLFLLLILCPLSNSPLPSKKKVLVPKNRKKGGFSPKKEKHFLDVFPMSNIHRRQKSDAKHQMKFQFYDAKHQIIFEEGIPRRDQNQDQPGHPRKRAKRAQ